RESYSLYGQATLHLSSRLRLSGGVRYTHDYNSTSICDYACDTPTFVQQSSNAWTGKAGVEYDLARKTMAYFTWSTGFKPGGGNISPTPIVLGYTFKPETVTAYELGAKSTMLGGRLRLNVAGFYYDYSNTQFEAEDAVAYQGGVANIPKLHIYGVEAEASALLGGGWRFDGNVTIEDSKITSHYMALDNVTGYNIDKQIFASGNSVFYDPGRSADIAARTAAYFDVYGNQAPNLPHVSATGTLSQKSDLPWGGALTSSLQGEYRSSYVNAVYGDMVINGVHVYRSPAYNLWNVNFTWQPVNPHFKFSASLKNIFNSGAVLGQFTNQFGGEITRQYAPPRRLIVSAAYNF
ncbi:MAG TPA: TonB-dependent receptor, partial [Novosphingobium sp.]|nr:TonB-dependent receptor [Novosphingobium sp.]